MDFKDFYYEGKTGIAETVGFEKKGLAELACNIGSVCKFGCTYCYVPAVVTKLATVQEVLKQGYDFDEFSLYRPRENVLACLEHDLRKVKPGDQRTVFFCTTCDPCPTPEHAAITGDAIALIMKETDLRVRVLSKSAHILDVADRLRPWRERVIFGLSTGTARPEVARAVEKKASPIQDRVAALHLLQEEGFRTFGMICPVGPFEAGDAARLVAQIRPEQCEQVFAEAMNVRGRSLARTQEALMAEGLAAEAKEMGRVMGDKDAWREYCMRLFTGLRDEMARHGQAHKLRFLQYVTREPDAFTEVFSACDEAVCL